MEARAAVKASPILSAKYVRPGYYIAILDAGLTLLILTRDEDRQQTTWFHAAIGGDLDLITRFAQSTYPDFDPLGWQALESRQEIEQYPNWPTPSVPSPHCLARSRSTMGHRRSTRSQHRR